MTEFDQQVFEIPVDEIAARALDKINEGVTVFDVDQSQTPTRISGAPESFRGFVPWGDDNLRPNNVLALRRNDEVMSSNIFFNILTGYGAGLKIEHPEEGKKITNKEVLDFFKYNRPVKYWLEQQTDIKHFFFTVTVLILSGDGQKIVKIKHKDATYCRFETCNPKTGRIEHVYFANFEKGTPQWENCEVIELLDESDPLGDLEMRMGKIPNEEGKNNTPTKVRKFAMRNAIPIPGNKYYPFPYSWAVFNSGWYDIKQLIAEGKKIKFKNGLVIKYQVEINRDYWTNLFRDENITDKTKQTERIKKEKENIKSFLTGMVNAGKVWFSGFYVDPLGKENSMIRINVINPTKEGGDWIEDTEEASNMECYADGIHPSLIGAVPGKSKGGMSGSDKRELFTIKQALDVPIRQILAEPYFVIINYNGWENDVKIDTPFMQLTTLDEGTSAKTKTADPNANSNSDNQD
ncbi:MAG TPA: hypothetical protein VI413_00625 [Paludibacter sp.]